MKRTLSLFFMLLAAGIAESAGAGNLSVADTVPEADIVLLRGINGDNKNKHYMAPAEALTGIVCGDDGAALPYAAVRVKGRPVGALGDSTGVFRLPGDKLRSGDTLLISYLGYHEKRVPASVLTAGNIDSISLSRRPLPLRDVVVQPKTHKKLKIKKIGKKHSSGMLKGGYFGDMAGEAIGFEFHAKRNKKLLLARVGFFYYEAPDMMTHMKFRVNVYDMSNVKGDMSSDFVNILSEPIFFEYRYDEADKGRFVYELPEPVELPEDAMVEIEFLENPGDKGLYFKSNLVGKQVWGKSMGDSEWLKNPFATPFFMECIELKCPAR